MYKDCKAISTIACYYMHGRRYGTMKHLKSHRSTSVGDSKLRNNNEFFKICLKTKIVAYPKFLIIFVPLMPYTKLYAP